MKVYKVARGSLTTLLSNILKTKIFPLNQNKGTFTARVFSLSFERRISLCLLFCMNIVCSLISVKILLVTCKHSFLKVICHFSAHDSYSLLDLGK